MNRLIELFHRPVHFLLNNLIMRQHRYPLPDRTVLYSRKKHMQPVPEVGNRYHCFDDGKIRYSRHFIIKVDEVLDYMAFRKKYPEQFRHYCEVAKEHYWLYSRRTDKFVVTYSGENGESGVYVRTKQGGWFGIGEWWNSAVLDVTGELWNYVISTIDEWDYTDEEKQRILQENNI